MFEGRWHIGKRYEEGIPLVQRIRDYRNLTNHIPGENGYEDLLDPFLVDGMDDAADLIIGHIKNGSRMVIHGDYDADGITSASILYGFLKDNGAYAEWFIPDRFDDGYGIAMSTAEGFVEKGFDLVITTDCGITAVDEVDYLKECGVDVIITDHHQAKDTIPSADAVLCNTKKNSTYPFEFLSGAGMAFKLVQALSMKLDNGKGFEGYTGLAAIGTIADIVPMTGENRTIAKLGLEMLRSGYHIGIDSLVKSAGIHKENLDEDDIGYVIGPRLNAAGRMGEAGMAFRLINADDTTVAANLAGKLSELNDKRKRIQEDTYRAVRKHLKENKDISIAPVIIVSLPGLNKGVLGIVASKITEFYNKPAVILSEDAGMCEGSGRSIEGFDLVEALGNSANLLESFGGHKMAAGLGISSERVNEFRETMAKYMLKSAAPFDGTLEIDTVCRIKEITLDSINEINSMGPFGYGNPRPIIAVEKAVVRYKKMIGPNGRHMKFRIEKDECEIECIAFNSHGYSHLVIDGGEYDVAFIPEKNEFRGNERLQANIVDLKVSKDQYLIVLCTLIHMSLMQEAPVVPEALSEALRTIGMTEAAACVDDRRYSFSIDRENVEDVYKALVSGNGGFTPGSCIDLARDIASLEILKELGIIELERKGLFAYDNIVIYPKRRGRLENSRIYRCLKEWNTKHSMN